MPKNKAKKISQTTGSEHNKANQAPQAPKATQQAHNQYK